MSDQIHPVTIPKWGIEMQEGTIADWQVEEGIEVNKGDELIAIETEKIVNTLEAPASGILRRRLVMTGDTLKVGALIGVISGRDVPDTTIDKFIAEFKPADAAFAFENKDTPQVSQQPSTKTSAATEKRSANTVGKVRLSPVVAQRARELGVDITRVTGSGRGGRLTIEDIEQYADQLNR